MACGGGGRTLANARLCLQARLSQVAPKSTPRDLLPLLSPRSRPVRAGAECELRAGGFSCPRCLARTAELPSKCHVCGLTLVSSPHLARSYHHLFPVKPFREVAPEEVAAIGVRERARARNWLCWFLGPAGEAEQGRTGATRVALGERSGAQQAVSPARPLPVSARHISRRARPVKSNYGTASRAARCACLCRAAGRLCGTCRLGPTPRHLTATVAASRC